MLHIIGTSLAIGAHALDITSTGGIGLAGEQTAIGVEAHPQHIGLHHPVVAIDEQAVEPGGEGLGIKARQQAVVGQHHQALNVVHIPRGLQLLQHGVHASHATATQLVQEGRQRPFMRQRVAGRVLGAEPPIQTVGVLPPAQDLPDHPLQAGEGCLPLPTGLLQAADHLQRMKQAQIEIGGKQGMPEGGLPMHHGVLVRAETIQSGGDEVLQHLQRLGPGYGPAEGFQITRQRCAAQVLLQLPHLGQHRFGDGIRGKPERCGTLQLARRSLAILLVVIPLTAKRLAVVVEQHLKTTSTLPIEQLQAQLAIGARPGGKGLTAPEEGVGGMPHERWERCRCQARVRRRPQPLDRLAERPFGRFHQVQFTDLVFRAPLPHQWPKVLPLEGVHSPTGLAQGHGEVAHGAPHQHELLAVVTPLQHGMAFHHQHPDAAGAVGGEGALVEIELVAQHPDADHAAAASPVRRQARRATAPA